MSAFKEQLLKEVIGSLPNHYTDNYDELQCGKLTETKKPFLQRLYDKRIPINKNLNRQRKFADYLNPQAFYTDIVNEHEAQASTLYDLLEDQQSKDLLVKIFAYKILGHTKVKLPRNTPKFWADNQRMYELDVGHSDIAIDFMNLKLPLLDLAPIGYNLKLNVHPIGVACIYQQRQYEYHANGVSCKAEPGDVVIDGGACFGDSSLYFAHEVGLTGKVYAFEFVQKNLTVFNANMAQNQHLSSVVQMVEHPLWHASNEDLFCAEHGPGSSVHAAQPIHAPPCNQYKTLSIDDLVEKQNLSSVDFIKMDIEGAEVNALTGALNTIKKFKPKLAISVYHKPDDFVTIPNLLNDLNLGYKFYLDHHTIHVWETVLFAVPNS